MGLLSRLSVPLTALTGLVAGGKVIRDANEKDFANVAPGEVHNRGRKMQQAANAAAAARIRETRQEIEGQTSATEDLSSKGPLVQSFSQTVTSAMEAITGGVGGAVQQMGALVSKINEAGQAAQNLKKSSMGFEVLKGIQGAKPIGTPGGDKSSSAGGPTSGRLAIDVTSSDGSVQVKSVAASGNAPVKTALDYRGRRMAEIG